MYECMYYVCMYVHIMYMYVCHVCMSCMSCMYTYVRMSCMTTRSYLDLPGTPTVVIKNSQQYMYTTHEKTGIRRNALVCRPHGLLELPELRDFNKLCGVQIGIVEVVYLNDCII